MHNTEKIKHLKKKEAIYNFWFDNIQEDWFEKGEWTLENLSGNGKTKVQNLRVIMPISDKDLQQAMRDKMRREDEFVVNDDEESDNSDDEDEEEEVEDEEDEEEDEEDEDEEEEDDDADDESQQERASSNIQKMIKHIIEQSERGVDLDDIDLSGFKATDQEEQEAKNLASEAGQKDEIINLILSRIQTEFPNTNIDELDEDFSKTVAGKVKWEEGMGEKSEFPKLLKEALKRFEEGEDEYVDEEYLSMIMECQARCLP